MDEKLLPPEFPPDTFATKDGRAIAADFWDEMGNPAKAAAIRKGKTIVVFENMVGHTITAVQSDADTLTFEMENGQRCRFYHDQDCCESVDIESITGDLSVLVGSPLTFVDEQISENENPPEVPVPEYQDSFTWTTYTFRTKNGEAKVRWYGSSNGYYSEDVNFAVVSGD